jgi:hypothetical protein
MWLLVESASRAIELTGRDLFWIVAGTVAAIAILAGTATSVLTVRARERTKREIAAYVAEGSMDPKDAVKLLKAGRNPDDDEDE